MKCVDEDNTWPATNQQDDGPSISCSLFGYNKAKLFFLHNFKFFYNCVLNRGMNNSHDLIQTTCIYID